MATLLLGMVLVVLAAVSLWDAARINSRLRLPGAFDLVGPDGYLASIAVLIGLFGVALVLQWLAALRKSGRPPQAPEDSSSRVVPLILGLLGYAVAIPIFGYIVSTIAFSAATFRIMGLRDWRWNIASAALLTACFYVAFVQIADMPLPKGIWKSG